MSKTPDLFGAKWVKSSYSGNGGGNCLEWTSEYARVHGVVAVRDSKVPNGGVLAISDDSWRAFVGAVGAEKPRSI